MRLPIRFLAGMSLLLMACTADPDPIVETELPTIPQPAATWDTVVAMVQPAGGIRASSIDAFDGRDGRIVAAEGERRLLHWGDVTGHTNEDRQFGTPQSARPMFHVFEAVSRGSNYFCYRVAAATGPIGCAQNGGVFTGIPLP